MRVPDSYSGNLPLRDKVLYVLSLIKLATADEVAMEIMELQGIASKDGVSDLTHDVEQELNKLYKEQVLKTVRKEDNRVYYSLS